MSKEELMQYLKDNLCIYVNQITEFGPSEAIEVELHLGETLITKSSCILPEQDTHNDW